MKSKAVTLGLLLTIVFQTAVLAGEYLGAVYPLWTGQEVRLNTRPVDPRSLFRGNYARLRYDITNIPRDEFEDFAALRNEEVVYVSLRRGDDDIYQYDGVSLEKPEAGVFIRGRLKKYRFRSGGAEVKYGIDAWFAPKQQALKLERDLRAGAVAVVMIAPNGKAALKAIEPDNKAD